MKNKIKCIKCGKEFTAVRKDAKYCSSYCRYLFWQESKNNQVQDDNIQNQLRGVLKEKSVIDTTKVVSRKTVQVVIPNPKYLELEDQLDNLRLQFKRLDKEKMSLEQRIRELTNLKKGDMLRYGAGLGALSGINNGIKGTVNNALAGLLIGACSEALFGDSLQKQNKQESELLLNTLKQINNKQMFISQEINSLQAKMHAIPTLVTVEKEQIDEPEDSFEDEPGELTPSTDKGTGINSTKRMLQTEKQEPNNLGSRIICSTRLMDIDYQALNFSDDWYRFFGQPSVTFHLAIHGMSGEGKSTFAIRFAHYLADNFGRVVYISSEEGFSKTMKDKFSLTNATSPDLFLADLKTYQDIVSEVKPNTFNFIFIDSLDDMKIGAHELKELRQLYNNSAMVTISQSTKDGKMRGSYEIVHDSDIAVSVAKGVAETTKNRFLKKGQIYQIFDEPEEPSFLPKNTVKG